LARQLAYSERPRLKQWLINHAIARFDVDFSEAVEADPCAYPSVNAFFTRAFKPDARPPCPDQAIRLMPADGIISQYSGTYDEAWQRDMAPLLPEDFDEQFFQRAPPDQQIPYPVKMVWCNIEKVPVTSKKRKPQAQSGTDQND